MSVSLARRELEVGLVPAGTWRLDPACSSVGFEIKDMGIATVRGRFTAFEGTLEAEVDGAFKAHGTIQTASIDTDDPKRDEHLRAPELFDVGGYPEVTFVSSGVRPAAGGSFGMFGNLTIKRVSRLIALTVTVTEVSVRRTPIPRAPPWDFHVLLETRGRTPERPWSCAAR